VLPAAWHLQALVLADGAEEIQRLVPLCRQYPARIHLLGLSSPDALTALYHARAAKLPMTASTRLQYLSDEAERLPKGREQREFLWAALAHGLLHTLSTPNLPVMWEAARRRGHALDRLAEWICSTPAKLAGLKRKGRIDVGYDADLVVFDHTRSSIQRTYLRGVSPRGELLNRSSGMSLASSKRQ
jgi:allantoinase